MQMKHEDGSFATLVRNSSGQWYWVDSEGFNSSKFDSMHEACEWAKSVGYDPAEKFDPSLRDRFAGLALQALISTHRTASVQGVAMCAYEYADAMMKEREKC